MKQATPTRDAVIYLGNDFITMRNKSLAVDEGVPAVMDTPPLLISDTPPLSAHDQDNTSLAREDDNDGTADA
jgi:hypothetical protein